MISFLQCIEAVLEGILKIQSVAIRCKNVPVGITTYRVEKYAMGKGKGDLHVLLVGASGEHCGAC